MLKKFYVALVFILLIFNAEISSSETVNKIAVVGNHRIESETIESLLLFKRGDNISEVELNAALKSLFSSGFFTDLSLNLENNTLTIKVYESPSISHIEFEGNKEVSDDMFKEHVQLRPRMLYSKAKVQQEVQRILAIYRSKGYFNAKVIPKVVELSQNRVDLVFEIEEGTPAEIESINFIGNHIFSDSDLRNILVTKESSWWRFFSSDDVYDPDRLNVDKDNLQKYYLNNGYVDFRVKSAVAELLPSKDGFIITFTMEEGERYKFGKIEIENKIRTLKEKDLKKQLTIKEGDWYSAEQVEKNIERLTNYAGTKGYALVDITPEAKKDEEGKVVGITLKIHEAQKVFIRTITISGNTRTIDSVIRRQITLTEGDLFNASKMRASDRNIEGLGFFKKADLRKEQVPGHEDLVDVSLNVEEQSTGEFNLSGGYATLDGLLAMIMYRERNLLGRGYGLQAKIQYAKRNKYLNIGFSNPYFLGRNLEAGVTFVTGKQDRESESSYEQFAVGGKGWLFYKIGENLYQNVFYKISRDKVEDVPDTASVFLKQQAGQSLSSSIGQTLAYDMRNRAFNPTKGYLLSWDLEYAGLGGNIYYVTSSVSAVHYYPLTEKLTWGISAEVSGIEKTTKKHPLRIIDKFFLGGQSLRGFDYGGVGPRANGKSNEALGGNRMYTMSTEVSFPFGGPDEFGLKGSLFVDAGSLWETGKQPKGISNSKKIRASIGAGIGVNVPMLGAIRLDYGIPFSKAKGDVQKRLLFTAGTGRF